MLRPKDTCDSVYLPAKTEAELVAILEGGPFDVFQCDEPLVSDLMRWQLYACHHSGALVTMSFAKLPDESEPGFITVATCRRLLWFWIRRRDRRLVHDVIEFLLKNGATDTYEPTRV